MKKIFVDTNIFLRFFINDQSKQHWQSLRFFTHLQQGKLKAITCAVVILELYFTLKRFYKYSHKKNKQVLGQILSLENLKIKDDFQYALALELFIQSKVKFNDCLIASLPFLQKGGKILSFDKDFDKLGIKRITPDKVK